MASRYYREVVKIIRKHGFHLLRQGAGSHEIWESSVTGRKVSIPRKLVNRHTANGILKDQRLNSAAITSHPLLTAPCATTLACDGARTARTFYEQHVATLSLRVARGYFGLAADLLETAAARATALGIRRHDRNHRRPSPSYVAPNVLQHDLAILRNYGPTNVPVIVAQRCDVSGRFDVNLVTVSQGQASRQGQNLVPVMGELGAVPSSNEPSRPPKKPAEVVVHPVGGPGRIHVEHDDDAPVALGPTPMREKARRAMRDSAYAVLSVHGLRLRRGRSEAAAQWVGLRSPVALNGARRALRDGVRRRRQLPVVHC